MPDFSDRKRVALETISEACETHSCKKCFALFSGGDDSLAALRVAIEHPCFVAAVHLNTGVGVEATRDFARETCRALRVPLIEYKAAENVNARGEPDPQVYEQLVLERGFPGPTQFGHGKMYSRLKERGIQRLEREHVGGKRGKREPYVLASGCRHEESVRRMGTTRRISAGFRRRDGRVTEKHRVWVNHIHDWTKEDTVGFRESCGLERNPVAKLICKSGECLCVDGDTPILTEFGWRPIRDISAGAIVWNYESGESGRAAVAVAHRNDPQPMIALKPAYLRPLLLTPNHPVYARTYRYAQATYGKPAEIGAPTWTEAGEIAAAWRSNRQKSTLCRTMHLAAVPFRRQEEPLVLTEPALRLLGHFAAEGAYNWRKDQYRDGPGGIVFTLSANATAHAQDIAACIMAMGWHVHRRDWTDERTGRNFITVRNCSRESSDFVSGYFHGRYCTEKQFADRVVTASLDEQAVILAAMWRGDGSVFQRITRDCAVSTYATTSIGLALQVHEMLLRRGEVYGIHSQRVTKYSSGVSYQVRKEGARRGRVAFIEDGILWTPITRVEDAGVRETFNLTIAGEPNYRTGSCLVHNCGGFGNEGELEELCMHDLTRPLGRYLLDLERRVLAAGFPWRWHEGPPKWWLDTGRGQQFLFDMNQYPAPGPMCQGCERRAAELLKPVAAGPVPQTCDTTS